jgi:hypothetical protein
MPDTQTLTGQDIAEAQGAVRALLDQALATTGNASNEYVALRVLSVPGRFATSAALHEFLAGQRQLGLDRNGAVELLRGLEARGLVSGADPVHLTPQGTALHARLAETIAPTTRELYEGIDPADLVTARQVLLQVIERADRLRGELARRGTEANSLP